MAEIGWPITVSFAFGFWSLMAAPLSARRPLVTIKLRSVGLALKR